MKRSDMPKFGNLQNLKVLNAASVVAGPFLCQLFAEQGADVIELESTRVPDMYRMYQEAWSVERRNQRMTSLNIPTPEGKEILLTMCKWADILVESSKGGTWEKWGVTDEVLWEANPALVIVHISGFGQFGDPSYINRGSFDSIGQAFSGYMSINGMPDPNPPYVAKPFMGDYMTGLMGAWAALAAYIRAKETGIGDSIDCAQFEALARVQGSYLSNGLNRGEQPPRMGNLDTVGACKGTQQCKDGWIFIAVGGSGPIRKMIEFFGLAGDPDFDGIIQSITRDKPERARKFNEKLEGYCADHTVEEVFEVMSSMSVPCSPIMTYQTMQENSHYKARKVFEEWHDEITDKPVKGVTMIPRFKKHPGQLVRGGAKYGADTEDIMEEFGYTREQLEAFYEKGIINRPKE